MNTLLIAALGLMSASPAPLANPKPSTDQPAVTTAAHAPTSARSDKTRYCVMTESTGSRIYRRVCQTRNAWLQEGFDPLAK